MKTLVGLTLVAIITISALNIFGAEDALTQLIVLGRLPGTEIQLGLGAIAVLIALCIPLIASWVLDFNDELRASKLTSIRSEAVSSYEAQVAESKLENVQYIAKQLEVDELDIISL